jgi:asparagine synthase (glutamine-hydrolysing)
VQTAALYTHDEIRRELRSRGHELTTRCDTEILPHLYEEAGARFPTRLHGKFGIAVWDGQARRIVLARDRLGVKPLYWSQVGDRVVFASELKCVIESGLVDATIDVEAVDLLMTLGYVPAPRTPLVGVQKLRPGAILVVDEAGAREELYWEYPRPVTAGPTRSLDEYADELSGLLRDAVTDRLMSDVPLGAMLSGGLDSSLIVAAMAAEMSDPVETFAVGFKEDPRNELADARRIADLFGCRHHEVELSVMDDALELEELVWHMDEPVADLSALGFDVLCRVAAEHVTVALSGQGADELFGGYTKHRAASALQRLAWLPGVSKRLVADVPWPNERVRRAARALAAPDPSARLLAMSAQLGESQRRALYRGELAMVDPQTAFRAVDAARDDVNGDILGSLLYLDAKLALADDMLLYFDRVSMAHSLEVRVPFLDHRLVEWAATIPPDVKVQRGVTKRVLKHLGARVLPEATVTKTKVGFFRRAIDTWLIAHLEHGGRERLSSPDARYREFIDGDEVVRLVDEYRKQPSDARGRVLFTVLLFDVWLDTLARQTATVSAR